MDDPATITLNDQITIGCTSADILVHLAAEEVGKYVLDSPMICSTHGPFSHLLRRAKTATAGAPYDRMSELLGHLLSQGSYYPLDPPAEGHSIDTSRMDRAQMKKNAPNILLTPSDFLPFVKRVGDTLCINASRVSKGNSGSFASILIHPAKEGGDLLDQIRVDVLTI